jgi:hypothetical protein
MVGNSDNDDLELIERDEYLVDWHATGGHEWAISWEPASNLVGCAQATSTTAHIDNYLADAAKEFPPPAKLPTTWRVPGKHGKQSAAARSKEPFASGRPVRASSAPRPNNKRAAERGGDARDGRMGDIRR